MAPNEKGGPKAAPHLLASTIIITNPALRLRVSMAMSPRPGNFCSSASRTFLCDVRHSEGRLDVDTVGRRAVETGIFSGCLMPPYFNDWKHFCLVLREIASGIDGYPLSGNEAQRRAQEALTGAGYRWPGSKPEAPEVVELPLQGKRRA
jgi:hypothetical protein